jgi:hypothetical protein
MIHFKIIFTKTHDKWVELTALVSLWYLIVFMQNKKSWYKEKIARPDMAPQNFRDFRRIMNLVGTNSILFSSVHW